MKTFAIAMVAVMLAVSAVPANAQAKRPNGEEKKQGPQKPVVDEKAYKAALEKIPDSKEKYDPWGVARPAEQTRKPK